MPTVSIIAKTHSITRADVDSIFIFHSPLRYVDWLFQPTKNGVRVRAHVYIREDEMNKFRGFVKSHTIAASLVSIGFLCVILFGARLPRAQAVAGASAMQSDDDLVADFRRVE